VSLSLFIEVFYFGEIILQNKVIWKSSYWSTKSLIVLKCIIIIVFVFEYIGFGWN
jgi:hypothetical protein